MNNIIYKIKNLTFEQINKNLVLFALITLIYRKGNFYNTFIPKPFEIILVFIILLTFFDLLNNNKLKDFFLSINKKIWLALSCLVLSVFIGWGVAIFVKQIPVNLNVVLEFGNFVISLVIFVLVLFYTKNDEMNAKRYLYALLLPVIYIVFLVFPEWAYYFHMGNNGTFLGFTMSPNIISKILLIPVLFFITYSLFEFKNKWLKVGSIIVSCALIALLFWVSSRGGLVALVVALIFLWLIFSFHRFNWEKLFFSGIIILMIFLVGFFITPETGKQRVILRILYPSGSDRSGYVDVQDKSARNVISKFISEKSGSPIFVYSERETRFQIWPFYFKQVLTNPLGMGPNTHFSFDLIDYTGEYINSGPHNTFLQIWLWGGLLGIMSFLFIFISAVKNLVIRLKSDFNPFALALLSSLFAVSVSIMFDDSLSFFWFFIILALALRYENARS